MKRTIDHQQPVGRNVQSLERGCFVIAALGLALCISAPEAVRYSALWHVNDEHSPAGMAVKALYLLICFLAVRHLGTHGNKPLHRNRAVLATLSLLQCVGFTLLIMTSNGWEPPAGISLLRSALLDSSFFLFAAYASFYLRTNVKTAIEAFVVAVIVAGTVQICMAFLPFAIAAACVTSFAPLSSCLLVVADRRATEAETWLSSLPESERAVFDDAASAPQDGIDEGARQHAPSSMRNLYATIALLSFVVAAIHLSWQGIRDGDTTSLIVQVCAGIGAVLGGNILQAVRHRFEDIEMVEFARLIVLPLAIGTLYAASLLSGSLIALSVIPLNIVYVAVLLLAWLAPFVYKTDRMPVAVSCDAFLAKRLGIVVGIGLMRDLAVGDLEWLNGVFIVVALGGLIVLSVAQFLSAKRQAERRASRQPTVHVSIDSEEARNLACAQVGEQYKLTPREREVLELLVRGRTASYIAETLVISSTTAKTHIKHIYQKTGVQSKQTLLDMVEEELQQLVERCTASPNAV